MQRIKAVLPPDGEVRIIKITDKQFGRMQVFYGNFRTETEQAPDQLSLF